MGNKGGEEVDFRGKKPPCVSNSEWDWYWEVGLYGHAGGAVGLDTYTKYMRLKEKIESCTPNRSEEVVKSFAIRATNTKGEIVDLVVVQLETPVGKIHSISYELKPIPADEKETKYFTP